MISIETLQHRVKHQVSERASIEAKVSGSTASRCWAGLPRFRAAVYAMPVLRRLFCSVCYFSVVI